MTLRSDPPPITYEVDPDAEEGDLVGALARLLVEAVDAEDAAGANKLQTKKE